MNDITALMATMKAAAESVIKNYGREWFETGCQICTVHKSKVNLISLANPVNVLELVEALEKAQTAMTAVVAAASIRGIRPFDGFDCDPPTLEENAEACGDAMSARIRELEANPPKPHHNGMMQLSNELAMAKHRIAELEESHAQVIQSRDHYKRMSEEGLKRIQESRTVTVKLPERCECCYSESEAAAFDYAVDECMSAFKTAGSISGIQVIEGET